MDASSRLTSCTANAPHDTPSLSVRIPAATSSNPSDYFTVSQAPMTSVSARRALFEKLGEGRPQSSSSAASTHSPRRSVSTPTVFLPSDSSQTIARQAVPDLENLPPLATRLLPAHTGSTVASTAVDSAVGSDGGLKSNLSRVRLAIMAINSMDKPTPSSRGASDGASSVGGRMSRSWSRMSSVTQINEYDEGVVGVGAGLNTLTLGEEGEIQEISPSRWYPLEEATPVLAHHPAESLDSFTWTRMDGMAPAEGIETHPPDMISPRTVLANVIHPKLRLRVPQSPCQVEDLASPESEDLFKSTVVEEVPESDKQEPPPTLDTQEEEVDGVDQAEGLERASTPLATPLKQPPSLTEVSSPAPLFSLRKNTPIVLRGQGRALSSPSTEVKGHRRRSQIYQLTASSPVPKRKARPVSTMLPRTTKSVLDNTSAAAERSHSVLSSSMRSSNTATPVRVRPRAPTSFQRHRRRSSATIVNIPVHEGPLALKALNPVPLRKVTTPQPAVKPMRFSVAF